MIKRYISLIICLGLIISTSSCSNEKSKRSSNTELNILVFDGGSPLNPAGVLEGYESWEEEFNRIFEDSINIEAKLIKPWGFSEMGDNKFENEVSGFTSGGIILMPTTTYDTLFSKREEYFEPITKYLINSDLRTLWPESLVNYGSFPGDGETWCLPTQYSTVMMSRAYNKKALDDMGLAAPTTIEELEFALGQYYLDYSKPPIRINPDLVNPMTQATSFTQFSDIFALGGIKNIETIVFDYSTEQYRNIIDFDSIESVINLLKDLYDGGLISIDRTINVYSNSGLLTDADIFTALVRGPTIMSYDEIEFCNLEYESNSLAYVDREQISHVAVMLKGTKNAEEVLNKFTDYFLKNGEKYIAASIGFEGKHFEFKDGILVGKKNPPYRVGAISHFSDYDIDEYIKDKERDAYKVYKEVYMANQHIIDPYYLSYFLTRNVFDGREQENEVQMLFSNVFSKLFTEDSNIQELIDEYKNLCYEKGVDNYIDKANYELEVIIKEPNSN